MAAPPPAAGPANSDQGAPAAPPRDTAAPAAVEVPDIFRELDHEFFVANTLPTMGFEQHELFFVWAGEYARLYTAVHGALATPAARAQLAALVDRAHARLQAMAAFHQAVFFGAEPYAEGRHKQVLRDARQAFVALVVGAPPRGARGARG